jgi:SAM-dependent methyltransferase
MREYLVSFYSQQGGVEFEYLEDQDYILMECGNCGLIYQRDIPNDYLMQKLYEEWIDPQKCFDLYERSRGIQYFDQISSEIVKIVKILGRPPMDLKFLDYGMGWGHWCRIAQSFGCTAHGTEISRAQIDYARSSGVTVIDDTEIADHQYDFINTEQVFEHLPDIRTTLNYLKKSLKPGGILKINVPNGWDIKRRLKVWNWSAPKGNPDSLNSVAPLEHLNCFNHASLLVLARSSGLFSVDTNPTSGKALDVKQMAWSKLRPYWHRLKGIRTPPASQGTYLFFRVSEPA